MAFVHGLVGARRGRAAKLPGGWTPAGASSRSWPYPVRLFVQAPLRARRSTYSAEQEGRRPATRNDRGLTTGQRPNVVVDIPTSRAVTSGPQPSMGVDQQ